MGTASVLFKDVEADVFLRRASIFIDGDIEAPKDEGQVHGSQTEMMIIIQMQVYEIMNSRGRLTNAGDRPWCGWVDPQQQCKPMNSTRAR